MRARAKIFLMAVMCTPLLVSAVNNSAITVKKPSFSIRLPGVLAYAAPEINTGQNLTVYRFVDNQNFVKQAMTVMVVKYDPKQMGLDLDKAVKNFTLGILIGHAKRDGKQLTFPYAQQLIQPAQINNRIYQGAELKIKNGALHIYSTHTQNTIYGFVLTSQDDEGVTEMRAALSSVQLLS